MNIMYDCPLFFLPPPLTGMLGVWQIKYLSLSLPPKRSYTNVTSNKSNQNFKAEPVKPLDLTSPNGGESWRLRTIRDITWASTGLSGKVHLQLWKNNNKIGFIAVNIPITRGSFAWGVGTWLMGSVSVGSGYKVKICTKDGSYFDISDETFSIIR